MAEILVPEGVRRSTRVLLLDGDDRMLLLHHQMGQRIFWLPPGGGIEGDETPAQAAVREVAEETGIILDEISHCIWTRHSTQFEYFFVARVASGTPVVTDLNSDAHELATLRGHRWWHSAAIEAARDEVFVPRRLGQLLPPILRGELPPEPVHVER